MKAWVAVAILAAVAVVGGGYYYMSKRTAPTPAAGNEQKTTVPDGNFTGSIDQLIARGGDWKCSVVSKAGDANSNGTVYVSGKMMRTDSSVAVAGKTYEAHLISDGSFTYSWSSATPEGIKTKVPAGATTSTGPTSGQGGTLNSNYSYNCDPATVDAAMFVPPTTVTFRSI